MVFLIDKMHRQDISGNVYAQKCKTWNPPAIIKYCYPCRSGVHCVALPMAGQLAEVAMSGDDDVAHIVGQAQEDSIVEYLICTRLLKDKYNPVIGVVVAVNKPAKVRLEVAPNIQTCPQETLNGVECIISGGKEVISVLIRPTAPGRMSRLQGLQNEVPTSSTKSINCQ